MMISLFPKSIEQMTKVYNFKLIHISTDCVFKGDIGRYDENFVPDAEKTYGISKILGECNKSALTLRTSIIGHSKSIDNICLLEWFLNQKNQLKAIIKHFLVDFIHCKNFCIIT